jgi:ribonucleoside-diphosphate reductase alpha chain
MTDRARLPNRRPCEALQFVHDRTTYRAAISRGAAGEVIEIFLDPGRPGSALQHTARDLAIAASMCFQHGCTPDQLRHSLTRLDDGSAAGPLGALLDLIAGVEQ